MSTADSRTNSIYDEERHYIGNLLDDDGPTVNHNPTTFCHPNVNCLLFQHRCQQHQQRDIDQVNRDVSGRDSRGSIVNHGYTKVANVVVNNDFAPPVPLSAQQGVAALDRGRKSYRDVASINRSGSSSTAAFTYSSIVYSESANVSASCGSFTLLKQPAKLRPRYSQSYYQHPPSVSLAVAKCNGNSVCSGYLTGGGRLTVGQQPQLQQNAHSTVVANRVKRTIPGLNPLDASTTAATITTFNNKPMAAVKGTARKQKSVTDFQRVGSVGGYSAVGGKRGSSNLIVAVETKLPAAKGNSVPATPASHSPPAVTQTNSDWTTMTKNINLTKTNCKKSDEFISVSYGNGGAKSRAAVDEVNVAVINGGGGKPADAKSRYEVLKKIGSIAAPNYENDLSMREASNNDRRRRGSDDNATTDSKRWTTSINTSASDRGRSMSIQDVELSRSSNRSNGKAVNGQKERGRTKMTENGTISGSTAVGGFWNAFRYLLFAVASAFAGGGGQRDAYLDEGRVAAGWLVNGPAGAGQLQPLVARLFAAAAGSGPIINGHHQAHRSGSTTSSTVNSGVSNSVSSRRRTRKNNQKSDTFLKCFHHYSTALLRIAWAAVLWIINLFVNFIVLLSLAIVVMFRQILNCF